MATKRKKQQEVVLKYTVEQQAANDVMRINAQIEKNLLDTAKAVERGGVAGVQAFKRLKNESKDLEKELRDVAKGFKSAGRSAPDFVDKATDKMQQLNREIKLGATNVRDFDEEFSQASQRVALAGDVGSQARTLGGFAGAAGGAGGAGIERGVSVLAEIPDSLEAIGRLKPALAGLPDVISSVATSIGPTGIGLGAAALLAVAGLSILSGSIRDIKKEAQEWAEQQAENAKVFADITQAIEAGDLAAAGQMVIQATQDLENAELQLAEIERERAEAIANITEFADVAAAEAINEQFDKMTDTVAGLNESIRTQTDTLEDYELSLTDVIDATKEATAAEEGRSAAILQNAELVKSQSLREAALLSQSSEALDSRLESIENERIATQAAINELAGSAEQTEEITDAIANYNTQLTRLGQEQEFINTQALQSAELREQQIAQQDKLKAAVEATLESQKEAAEERAQLLEEQSDLELKLAEDLVDISKKAAEESEKALANLQTRLSDLNKGIGRDFEKAGRDRGKKELEARIKIQQAEVDAFTSHNQKLNDIRRDAFEEEEDAQQTRGFKQIFNIRRNARRQIQNEQRDFSRQSKQRGVETDRARDERIRNFDQQRQERLIKFSQDVSDTRLKFATERALARQNVIDTIGLRRQQFSQELADLQQKHGVELQLRRNAFAAETGMIADLERFATSAFSRIGGLATGGFEAFGSGGNNNTTNNSNATNVNAPITVNAAPNQSAGEIGNVTQGLFKVMIG